jgi:hypothetical protein
MGITNSQPVLIENPFEFGAERQVRTPDFFIVGAPRCGTTALYSYLRKHPEIFMPTLKEPDFFAPYLGTQRRIQTWPEYLALFAEARDEKRVGEASPSYLGSDSAASALNKFCPQASIIIMLRNPIEVMHSLYYVRKISNLEDQPSFEAALDADSNGRRVIELPYRERVRFAEQVERYLNIFGREQVHIIIYDDFKKDTAAVYRKVLNFLGVSGDITPDFSVINGSRRARNEFLWKLLKRPPGFLRKMLRPITSYELRKSAGSFLQHLNTIYEPRPTLDPKVEEALRRELAPEVKRLSELLDRDLTHWCSAQ